MNFPIRTRVKNFSNPESFEKSLEQNATDPKVEKLLKKLQPGDKVKRMRAWCMSDVTDEMVAKIGVVQSKPEKYKSTVSVNVKFPGESAELYFVDHLHKV